MTFRPSATVSDAVATRRSIRAFTAEAVDPATLDAILAKAGRAASGGNLQPWEYVVLTGDRRQALIDAVAERIAMGLVGMQPEYPIYPPDLPDPWEGRRRGVGKALYDAMGIRREDREARDTAMRANFEGFGAPVLLMLATPRFMGPPQWGDMGIWLGTVMLLLREVGLDSCPQEAWAMYGETVRAVCGWGDDMIFWTGLAIGHRDVTAAVNNFPVPRREGSP